MARPHIEFIQSQALPWQKADNSQSVFSKVLSQDPQSGESTRILRYSKGFFIHFGGTALETEFFVLRGLVSLGNKHYRQYHYGCLPSGFQGGLECHADTDLLVFTNINSSADPISLHVQTDKLNWSDATDHRVAAATVGLKELRLDPVTKERTWLLKIEAQHKPFEIRGIESHPVVEEMFVLEGSVNLLAGELCQGAYFWRPPHIEHGPTGCKQRFLGLFRCRGGAFSTDWRDSNQEITWSSTGPKNLPPGLRVSMEQDWDQSLPY